MLYVPIILYIDTSKAQYFIQIKGLAKASIKGDASEIIKVHLKVLIFNFEVYPLRKINFFTKPKGDKKAVKKKRLSSLSFKRILNILRSCKIKKFKAEIDTGDCILNSKLYPVFALLNFYKGINLSANFESKNNVLLAIENRPIRIIKLFINN